MHEYTYVTDQVTRYMSQNSALQVNTRGALDSHNAGYSIIMLIV